MLELLQCVRTLTLKLDFHFVELKELTHSQICRAAQVVSNNCVAVAKNVFNALCGGTQWHLGMHQFRLFLLNVFP